MRHTPLKSPLLKTALLASALAALCACASSAPPARGTVSGEAFKAPDVVQPVARQTRPGDMLTLDVFNEPQFSGKFRLDDRGVITHPVLGDVDVNNRSLAQVEAILRERLARNYVRNPRVTASLSDDFTQQVTVEGAVTKPGLYPADGDLTLLRVLALSGGTTEFARTKDVIVFRNIDGERQAAVFDLNDIRVGRAEDPRIYGNDYVVITDDDNRRRYREVLRAVPLLGFFRPF